MVKNMKELRKYFEQSLKNLNKNSKYYSPEFINGYECALKRFENYCKNHEEEFNDGSSSG